MQYVNERLYINYRVPFCVAPSDATHCVQATLQMVLKYFWPSRDFSIEELDRITAKVEGLWTWGFARAIWLEKHGFEVIDMGTFDNEQFIQKGEKYLLDAYGEEWTREQIKHSNIEQERRLAKEYIKKTNVMRVVPTLRDVQDLLIRGYLVICIVNWRTLHNKVGYAGHSVVIKGFNSQSLIMHDPGPPAQKNCPIAFELFEKAWAYPDASAKYLTAIKLKTIT